MLEPQRKHIEIRVPEHQAPQRIDKFLTQFLPDTSRTYIQSLIESGSILIDGQPVKASQKVMPLEKIDVYFKSRPKPDILPENIPLDIIYEDESLLVVNKAAGMVVHPAFANYSGTLVNALLYHYQAHLSTLSGADRPGIVHRLDKDTSGLLVVAKSDTVHAELAKQFAEKKAFRKYLAVVWGNFPNDQQTVSTFLARSRKNRTRMTVVLAEGKWAITHVKVLERFPLATLVEANLETGRTHQIRIHMAYIGHPVVGDPTYGGRRQAIVGFSHEKTAFAVNLLKMMPRQALHAYELRLFHPILKREMSFTAPLPVDITSLIDVLKKEKSQGRS